MVFDLLLVLLYFVVIMWMATRGGKGQSETVEEFFLSSRQLRWPSIAISTIATNLNGYQFLGMMGSAYLYGIAQANLEINAVNGLLLAAFVFVPLYLKDKVMTITQFIKSRLGERVATTYSVANLLLLSTVGLGSALFWGAYAADIVLGDYLEFISDVRIVRVGILIVFLGLFSATYTYFGGLRAVVRTDIIQFAVLVVGATILLLVAVHHLGGWAELYNQTPEKMHLHLPSDHEKLPWIAIGGMFLLNINYWCANQSIVQRSLAARSLKDAQVGLLVGGVMKYFMAVLIIVPGIALAGILVDNPLTEPDQTFPYLVKHYLPTGLRGLILCALFASLMSTVDSLFNSLATLFTVDIYKTYVNKKATDAQMVGAGRKTILFTLATGVLMGWYLLYAKFENPEEAFTHNLNEIRYYINCGIVVVICGAAMLVAPKHKWAFAAFLSTIPLHLLLKFGLPALGMEEMNYFVRAMWVILAAFFILVLGSKGFVPQRDLWRSASKRLTQMGWGLLASLGILHWVFH